MDSNSINAFKASIQNVFSTMFQLTIEIGVPSIKNDKATTHDVSGIIGVSGEMVGSIVLSMPRSAAVSIVALFTGTDLDPQSEDFADAVGELASMIAGNAKAEFQRDGVYISCPSVVVGAGHRVSTPAGTACVMIPCNTNCGEVVLEIALRDVAAGVHAQTQAA